MEHLKVNGQLLNMDKKFSHLKQKQKQTISEWLYYATLDFYNQNKRMPNKNNKIKIVDKVYEKIEDASIWIPFGEVLCYYISHYSKYEKRICRNIRD